MNIFKTIVTICAVAFLYVTVSAQDFYDEFRAKSIDVEGVKIGRKMTYDQFVAKFGKPTEYTQSDSGEGGESSIDGYYKVGQDVFYFQDNGAFSGFSINENKFSVLTLWITDGIRVGDKLSKLDNFKYGKPKVASWLKPENGFVEYAIFYNHLDAFVYLSVKDGVIHNIRYSDPT